MKFFSIKRFDFQINQLTKKRKDGYKDCLKDIAQFFLNKNFDEIFNNKITIEIISETILLKKSRIKNSTQNLSARDGYRLIYLINKSTETVYLLYIYPKRGKYSQNDITNNELKTLKKLLEIALLYQTAVKYTKIILV